MDEQNNKWFEVGTHQCGLLFGAIGAIAALLLVFIGFWKTLLVALFFVGGYLLGSLSNKSAAFKRFINNLFPPKGQKSDK